mmetsp:Transcript_15077/g.22801  ORF Transcript_15077/g.22801 Transcript_15077/m.22801 type:complete len:111 (-) Transcript_15077:1385-1717(-)
MREEQEEQNLGQSDAYVVAVGTRGAAPAAGTHSGAVAASSLLLEKGVVAEAVELASAVAVEVVEVQVVVRQLQPPQSRHASILCATTIDVHDTQTQAAHNTKCKRKQGRK